MSTIAWPSNLPDKQFMDGLSVGRKSQFIETPMEFAAKRRRRYTAQRRPWTVRVRFTRAQVEFFDTWFDDTLGGGTLPFSWRHPITQAVVSMHFAANGEPSWVPVASGTRDTALWEATFNLEILP
jgi:hypothetical protein